MMTEDEIARDLRSGKLTLDEALGLFEGTDVLVYPAVNLDSETATWDEVEDAGAGSADLFSALRQHGASEEQMDRVGANIERLRAAGQTFP
jgi:hypothetical protein